MRVADAVRAVFGAAAVLGTGTTLRLLRPLGGEADGRVAAVARVLGARWVVQAVLGTVHARRPRRDTHGHGGVSRRQAVVADALVEAAHGTSMLLLAVGSPRYRRWAEVSAATAFALAVADGSSAVRDERRRRR
jgi:hypothetical protein